MYTQTRTAEKQHTNDFLNGERLSPKLPHHAQLQEEPSELELKLALLQLDMIRRNAGRTEVKKIRNASHGDPWDQVESLFSGPTPATLAQWLKDKAKQLCLESWHDAPPDIAQKAFTKEKVEEFMRLAFFDALSSSPPEVRPTVREPGEGGAARARRVLETGDINFTFSLCATHLHFSMLFPVTPHMHIYLHKHMHIYLHKPGVP
eukprot:4380768-Pleurochrysis_carterae.AAC.5